MGTEKKRYVSDGNLMTLFLLILCLIVFFATFENVYYSRFFHITYRSMRTFRMAVIGFFLLITRKFNLEDAPALGFLAVYFATTYFLGGQLPFSFDHLSDSIVVTVFLIAMVGESSQKMFYVMDVFKWILLVVVLIDVGSFFLYPNGMYLDPVGGKCWFLGYKTHRMDYYLPASFFFSYTSFKRKGQVDVTSIVVMLLCFLGTVLCSAAGAALTMLFCIVCVLYISFYRGLKTKKVRLPAQFFNYRICVPGILIITVLVTFIQWERLLVWIATRAGRSPNLSARTVIWEKAIQMVIAKPIFGYGYLTSEEYIAYLKFANAHSILLTILIAAGAVGLFFALLYLYVSFRGTNSSDETMLVSIFCYAFLILGIASSVHIFTPFCFVPFYCLRFCKDRKKAEIRSIYSTGVDQ